MEPWHTIVLLGAVAVVFAVIMPRKSAPGSDQSSTVRNMETALEQFMENMEADNREMVELVTSAQKEAQEQAKRREERINQLEQRCGELEQSLVNQAKSQPAAEAFAPGNQPAAASHEPEAMPESAIPETAAEEVQEQEAASIRNRYTELFALHDNGKSVEAIAKKLGMNKGEVLLILQLSRQEEESRHE
ncbi:hypothetical protein K0T92_00770 [Paenibacillus oenotherae]|uniref:Uncharacterized protein n=1 Tax=Paenibacillus oenotherae TaxID=1435645 RepID=A0ABS7D046_9BACL|nr:hypothetical protein [Paenibacillus oenotherae]MBW7473270.1 hypothetical protein [Paenibacillus oenotherae]